MMILPGKSVQFNDEPLRFKREQMREIVHALCLKLKGSSSVHKLERMSFGTCFRKKVLYILQSTISSINTF